MLKEKLMDDLKSAMREKDDLKKDTVQMIRAAILQVEKDNAVTLEDDKEYIVVDAIVNNNGKYLDSTQIKDEIVERYWIEL